MLRNAKKTVKFQKNYDDFVVQTVISEGLSIEGNLIGKGSVKIDGSVLGNIRIEEGLIVGEVGDVSGDVSAENVIVFGRITGDITCKTIKVNASGMVSGNVTAEFIGVDLGGKINGKVEVVEEKKPLLLDEKVV